MKRLWTVLFLLMVSVAAVQAADPALLNLIMPDAKVVSGMQVDASKSSAFGQYVLSQMQADNEDFKKFVADTGFDPRRDLSEVIVATGAKADDASLLVLGRGIFNPSRFINAARAAGANLTSYAGIDLLTHSPNSDGALAFLDGSTAVMGGTKAVQAAIDRRSATTSALPDAVLAKIRTLSAQNDAWFMTTGPLSDFFSGKIADPNLKGAMAGNLLQAVLQANGGIKFSADSVRINGEALTRSDKDAQALADVIRFIAGLVQMNKDNDPNASKIASLLDTMQVSTDAATMRMSLNIPESMVEKLFVPPTGGPVKARGAKKRAAL